MSGPIPLLPPVDAPPELLVTARDNCAARYRARGYETEASAFALGERDGSWALRHEVNKLRAEQANGVAAQ